MTSLPVAGECRPRLKLFHKTRLPGRLARSAARPQRGGADTELCETLIQRTDGRTDGQTDGRMDGRTDGRADGRTNGWTDGRTGGRTNGRTDTDLPNTEGLTDGRTARLDELANTEGSLSRDLRRLRNQTQLLEKQVCCTMRFICCLLYTSPSPRDGLLSRMPSSA